MYTPLEQFKICSIYNLDIIYCFTISNITVYLLFILVIFIMLFIFPVFFARFIPTYWQLIIEDMYIFLINIGRQQFSNITSFKFFPLIGSTFPFILLANFTGSTPLAFTITSHIYVTFLLAFSLFLGITILGIYYNKLTFIRFFLPTGVPKFLIPFLIVIEVISYLIRPFSLSIRLFANMLAGHTLLVILSGFVLNSSIISVLGIHLIPFIFVFLVVSLEIGIAFIQAYVFCVLLFIYLNDVYKLIP